MNFIYLIVTATVISIVWCGLLAGLGYGVEWIMEKMGI